MLTSMSPPAAAGAGGLPLTSILQHPPPLTGKNWVVPPLATNLCYAPGACSA